MLYVGDPESVSFRCWQKAQTLRGTVVCCEYHEAAKIRLEFSVVVVILDLSWSQLWGWFGLPVPSCSTLARLHSLCRTNRSARYVLVGRLCRSQNMERISATLNSGSQVSDIIRPLSDHKLPIYAIAHQQRLSQEIGDGSEFRQLFFVCGMTMVLVKLFMS